MGCPRAETGAHPLASQLEKFIQQRKEVGVDLGSPIAIGSNGRFDDPAGEFAPDWALVTKQELERTTGGPVPLWLTHVPKQCTTLLLWEQQSPTDQTKRLQAQCLKQVSSGYHPLSIGAAGDSVTVYKYSTGSALRIIFNPRFLELDDVFQGFRIYLTGLTDLYWPKLSNAGFGRCRITDMKLILDSAGIPHPFNRRLRIHWQAALRQAGPDHVNRSAYLFMPQVELLQRLVGFMHTNDIESCKEVISFMSTLNLVGLKTLPNAKTITAPPLLYALRLGLNTLAEYMVFRGACPDYKDETGRTPREVARGTMLQFFNTHRPAPAPAPPASTPAPPIEVELPGRLHIHSLSRDEHDLVIERLGGQIACSSYHTFSPTLTVLELENVADEASVKQRIIEILGRSSVL